MADGNWHLVAVTVDRDNPAGIRFEPLPVDDPKQRRPDIRVWVLDDQPDAATTDVAARVNTLPVGPPTFEAVLGSVFRVVSSDRAGTPRGAVGHD